MQSVLIGAVLGIVTGVVPGAFTTVVAATAFQRGLGAGLRISLVPLFTEIPALLATVFVLKPLPRDALPWAGGVGGGLVVALGAEVIRRARKENVEAASNRAPPKAGDEMRHLTQVTVAGILSPAPWIFWLVVAGPFLLRAWNQGWTSAAGYLGAFFVTLIGSQMGVAWLGARGRKLLGWRARRRLLTLAGAILVGAGALLAWQSVTGNFQPLIDRQKEVQEQVEDGFGKSSNSLRRRGLGDIEASLAAETGIAVFRVAFEQDDGSRNDG